MAQWPVIKAQLWFVFAYARALLEGHDNNQAKQRGMVAAIMDAQARLEIRKEHQDEFQTQKEAAEKKKKTTITAALFDRQVANKMGGFFDEVFLPGLKKLVEAGLSYDDVKRLAKIPSAWGAKIAGASSRTESMRTSQNDEPVSMGCMLAFGREP